MWLARVAFKNLGSDGGTEILLGELLGGAKEQWKCVGVILEDAGGEGGIISRQHTASRLSMTEYTTL